MFKKYKVNFFSPEIFPEKGYKCLKSSSGTYVGLEAIKKEKSHSQDLGDLEGDLPSNWKST